jgi:tetratricopeptide (TPR) repeat protein
MTADQYHEKIKELRNDGNHQEAVSLSEQFIRDFPKDANAWWSLTLSNKGLEKYNDAIWAVKETIKLVPKWAPAWAEYGIILEFSGQLKEAVSAFEKALELDYQHYYSHFQLERIYKNNKSNEKRLVHLEYLFSAGKLDSDEINTIGTLYYEKNNLLKALYYFKCSSELKPNKFALYNEALVYQKNDFGQLIDARDRLMEAVEIDSAYLVAIENLRKIEKRIKGELTNKEILDVTILKFEDWFQNYINPLELLGLDAKDVSDVLDIKQIQKCKKKILQEIELEDGRVSTLQDYKIEQSKAIEIINELNNERILSYHCSLIKEPLLLYFLTRGDVRFFSPIEGYYPKEAIIAARDKGFLEWVSPLFATQYELVVGKAIEARNIKAIKALLSGRRVVDINWEEKCFAKIRRFFEDLIEPIHKINDVSTKEKPDISEIKKYLNDPFLRILFSHSKHYLAKEIETLVYSLRSISIDFNNIYNEKESSLELIKIALDLTIPKSSLNAKIKVDCEKIQEIIDERANLEARMSLGCSPMHITAEGVFDGKNKLLPEEIVDVRVGMTTLSTSPNHRVQYLLAFSNVEKEVIFTWRTEPSEEQTDIFTKMNSAAFIFIYPHVLKRMSKAIKSGKYVYIDDMVVNMQGLIYEKNGFFSSKKILIPWNTMNAEIKNGDLIVKDSATGNIAPSKAISLINNAFLFPELAKKINENN